MCLGVPGEVLSARKDDLGLVSGRVRFGGVVKEVNLSYTPEVEVGDYVVVHVGFSISRLAPDEALRVFEYLEELGEVDEVDEVDEVEPSGDGDRVGGKPGDAIDEVRGRISRS